MNFGAPSWLWALCAIPILAALYLLAEKNSAKKLHDFASARLLPQLAGAVDRFRRGLRFALQLLGLALAIVSLAQPRWGYTFEESKRKGIDLFIAVDTSRSMLSNDVQPNRLERVKLAAQDLINLLQGDRVGLIAFAGRAFVQAPLTIDYGAVIDAVNDLDTKTIPEGGTNISEAITLADKTYGKSATGNRALVIFTDGEELSGDAVKTAKAAAAAGARIFTIGVGTEQGSLIPIPGDNGSAFVKDSKGQVVKSKLDEKRLREVAEATGGFYLHLENGPRSMQQLFNQGITKIQAADIDVRTSRRAIERYQWPLGAGILALALSMMIGERKRVRRAVRPKTPARVAVAGAVALLLLSIRPGFGAAPGLDAYGAGKFGDAYQEFQQTLKTHPQTEATDKLNFDSGAAAYKMKDYNKALESFSQALLTPDTGLQGKSHYNLGNTLYQRGDGQKTDERKLKDWTNALEHYDETLKIDPQNKEAKENYDYVKKKIEELKNKPKPTPTPTPPQNKQDQKKDKQKNDQQKQDQQKQDQQKQDQQQQKDQQQQQDQQQQDQQQQQQQQQDQSGQSQNQQQKQEQGKDQQQAKNDQQKKDEPKPGESPSPSPSASQSPGDKQQKGGSSPSPSPGDKNKQSKQSQDQGEEPSPTPGDGQNEMPSPTASPGEGEGSGSDDEGSPSPTPDASPKKKLAGELKGKNKDQADQQASAGAQAEAEEEEKDGKMSEKQAQALLQSMRDEEARVQLDERRPTRRVYNDW